MKVSGGRMLESISQFQREGEESVFPAASVALTSKLWLPSANPVYVFGVEQFSHPNPSRLHSNVLFGSLLSKAKVAVGSGVGFGGLSVIVVSGSVKSTVQFHSAGVRSSFPASSIDLTIKM